MASQIDIDSLVNKFALTPDAAQDMATIKVYIDSSAPLDLQNYALENLVVSSNDCFDVSVEILPEANVYVAADVNLVVLVAGLDPEIGRYFEGVTSIGVPVCVVSSMPVLVGALAASGGYSLDLGTLISPQNLDCDGYIPKGYAELEPRTLDQNAIDALNTQIAQFAISAFPDRLNALSRNFPFMRRAICEKIIKAVSTENAGICFSPLSSKANLPVVTINQIRMVLNIASVYEAGIDIARVKQLVAVGANAFVCRTIVRCLVKIAPIFAWLTKALVGFGATRAIGAFAVSYFEGLLTFERIIDDAYNLYAGICYEISQNNIHNSLVLSILKTIRVSLERLAIDLSDRSLEIGEQFMGIARQVSTNIKDAISLYAQEDNQAPALPNGTSDIQDKNNIKS